MKKELWAGGSALILGVLACQPVLAIGWREAVLILLLVAWLIGPPVYRFLRRLEQWREKNDK
ncbi:MAG: hypothetical protein HRF47_16710 [Chloroflexota bacterium]|jgi:hypothetical protein